MNSSVLTASLTGRIQFFYCVTSVRFDCGTAPATSLTRCALIPPLVLLLPRRRLHRLCAAASRGERGYEPRARFAPCTALLHLALPAACPAAAASRWSWVEVRRFARGRRCCSAREPSELEIPLPQRDLLPLRACERSFDSQPVSADDIQQGACQSHDVVRRDGDAVNKMLRLNALADPCPAV